MIVTPREPGLFLSMETAHLLEQLASVRKLRGQLRGVNPKAAQELLDLREMSLRYELLPEVEVGFSGSSPRLEEWNRRA